VPEIDLDAYLARIGYRGRLEPDLRTLTALHAAHVTAVPFENLDILLGRRISLELPALQAKIVEGGRGGYCFELNTLFQGVLDRLGFHATPLAARVRMGMTEVRPRTHMLLRVELDEGAYLADVGFGGDGLVHPLSFAPGAEVRMAGVVHRLRREEDLWVLTAADMEGDPSDLYAFTLEPQHAVDYEMANHYTSTWPASKFVQTLTAQRAWPEGRAILRNRDLTVREGGSVRAQTIRDPEHLLLVLEREFGLSFPAGTRFTRPEF
jgi:N-hydroxyarylamine O-acetyltransferase